jgi:hypothetical protein
MSAFVPLLKDERRSGRIILQLRSNATEIGRERTLAAAVDLKVEETSMIRKLSSGQYRLYSRKINPKTGKCPGSDIRIMLRHVRLRMSEPKGH